MSYLVVVNGFVSLLVVGCVILFDAILYWSYLRIQ
jgi:hypothetical protein